MQQSQCLQELRQVLGRILYQNHISEIAAPLSTALTPGFLAFYLVNTRISGQNGELLAFCVSCLQLGGALVELRIFHTV